MSHPEFAQEAMAKIAKMATDAGVGQVERHPLIEGRQMIMILSPSKEAMKKAAQRLESRTNAKQQGAHGKPVAESAESTKPADDEDEDEELDDEDLEDDDDLDEDEDEDDEDGDESVSAETEPASADKKAPA
jgi:hypothetical protein